MSGRGCFYLVSAAGYPNYGDELVTAAWLHFLAKVAPDADVWLDCQDPGTAQLLLGRTHPRLRVVDTLWRLCRQARSEEPWEVAAWVRRAVGDPGLAPRWAAGIELLGQADVVHVLGGGYLAGLWPAHLGLLAGAAEAVGRSGGRAVMTGQGLHPAAPGAGPLLRALADRFDLVDLRDEPSARLVREPDQAAAHTSADDSFLILRDGVEALVDRSHQPPEFMLCLQPDAGQISKPALAGRVLAMLRAWRARPDQVGVVEGIPGADREVYALLEHELPGARFYPFAHIWQHGLPLGGHQKWISTRFHVHLLAAAAGAAGVAVSVHDEYYSVKHRSLIEAGSGWTISDDADRTPPMPEPSLAGFGPETLRLLAERKTAVARRIYLPGSNV